MSTEQQRIFYIFVKLTWLLAIFFVINNLEERNIMSIYFMSLSDLTLVQSATTDCNYILCLKGLNYSILLYISSIA